MPEDTRQPQIVDLGGETYELRITGDAEVIPGPGSENGEQQT